MIAQKCLRKSSLSSLLTRIYRKNAVRSINNWNNILCHKPINNEQEKTMYKSIYARIKACGPITVADYMKEVLNHPTEGYYMSKDVIGPQGDFITAPEISQLFGEMIAVWILNEWFKITEGPVQLIELGPGKGTLVNNILRIVDHFKLSKKVSLHLVEISPTLSKIQAEKICVKFENVKPETNPNQKHAVTHYIKGITKNGTEVFWYYSIKDIPRKFSIYVAHEFFDALPIHKFQKTDDGWNEVMIDLDPEHTDRERFRYVLVKGATPGSQFYLDVNEKRNHVEISPESLVIIDYMADVLNENGGFALIIDYGHDGDDKDSFRAFRKHKQTDPLLQPGSSDLTADVDFSLFRKMATRDDRTICFGPVEQRLFLKRMGIDLRKEMLIKQCSENHRRTIQRGYDMITGEDYMGIRFKAFSMFPAVLKEHLTKHPVGGFYEDSKKKLKK